MKKFSKILEDNLPDYSELDDLILDFQSNL